MNTEFLFTTIREMKYEALTCHKHAIKLTEIALNKRAELMSKETELTNAVLLKINLMVASECNEVTYWERKRDLNLGFLRTSISMEEYHEFITDLSKMGLSLGGMV